MYRIRCQREISLKGEPRSALIVSLDDGKKVFCDIKVSSPDSEAAKELMDAIETLLWAAENPQEAMAEQEAEENAQGN
jgi:hypothetical protein